MTRRLLLAVVFVLLIQGGVVWIQRNYVPGEVELPDRELDELPSQLGSWVGESTPIDPKVFVATGADSMINRLYRNPSGQEVVLHSTISTGDFLGVPHFPEVCYTGNGWRIADAKTSQIKFNDSTSWPARILTLEREGKQLQVLFWYQLGIEQFVNRDGFRQARRQFWGQPTWRPVIKFMLQTNAVNLEQSERRLRELAQLVFAWSNDL